MKARIIASILICLAATGCSKQDREADLLELDRRFNAGEYEHVIQQSEKYLEQYPQSYKAWSLLGWAYLKTDQLEQAERCLDRSLSINDKWDNAYVGKGVLYRKLGELDKARESYEKAISLVPDNAEAFSSLLVIELMLGNDEQAVRCGEKAWALRKDYPAIPANLAAAYHYLGDFQKRDEYYRHAERLGYHNLEALQDIFDGKTSIR